ncbi:MAG TPA: signal peptidase II [Candidatus Dormibacteraeota bacterium]|nr:signal peptidase II [Candidatus Dormibacteraeota bacterium]
MAFAAVAVAVFVADRVTKNLVSSDVPYGTEFAAIDHLVWITNIHNSGAAFGLAPALALVFLVASLVVAIALVVYVATHRNDFVVDAVLGLILGGTIGNGFDRVMYGTVTDFIALHFWPVFNVADAAVSVGVVLFALGYLIRKPRAA